MTNQIVWQPNHLHQGYLGMDILLDTSFAKSMYDSPLSESMKKTMNEMGQEALATHGYRVKHPFSFAGESALVQQIKLDGAAGRWLELETRGGVLDWSQKNPLTYQSKNLIGPKDIPAILACFSLWIDYADVLKE